MKPKSVFDMPEYHCKIGYKFLAEGEYEKALEAFRRAYQLDPHYSLAYIGIGLTYGEKGEFEKAFSYLKKAKSRAKRREEKVSYHIGMGRLYSLKKDEGWLQKAENEFKKATKLNPKSGAAYYFRGKAYKEAYLFEKALKDFQKVLELEKEWTKEAERELTILHKIQKASPGTIVGKKIGLVDRITRAEVAALFYCELDLEKILERRQASQIDTSFVPPVSPLRKEAEEKRVPTDIVNHWAKDYIKALVELDVIPLYPDGTFRPDEFITKAVFTKMVFDLIVAVTGRRELETKFFGAPSPFRDVRSDHFAFPAIMTLTTWGIIEPWDKVNGIFGVDKSVSGADALLVIREIKNAALW